MRSFRKLQTALQSDLTILVNIAVAEGKREGRGKGETGSWLSHPNEITQFLVIPVQY